jgi:hypothetical protein
VTFVAGQNGDDVRWKCRATMGKAAGRDGLTRRDGARGLVRRQSVDVAVLLQVASKGPNAGEEDLLSGAGVAWHYLLQLEKTRRGMERKRPCHRYHTLLRPEALLPVYNRDVPSLLRPPVPEVVGQGVVPHLDSGPPRRRPTLTVIASRIPCMLRVD